ncbi:MAG: pimeloyl-[acyl-carrier protein] methyl ester esterase [Methylococcales bacterium]|jgi:pimeloyl-[acyl-carrier protein] methyl ester esterase|nr:MAG: pimeloyl-[acyl-carrier protein] methyl ester esterase [Methylococcales bacterium]
MINLHQQTFGTGKSIVLVHGWAMHSGIWHDFAMQLAQHYQVTCIDLPGHGHSDNLDNFTLEQVADALVDAVADKQSCWLGWSLGATVVMEIAKRYPERVNSLILLAGNPHFTCTEQWPGMKVDLLEAFSEQLTLDAPATLLRFLSLQVAQLPDYKVLLKNIKTAIMARATPNLDTLQGGLTILKQADLRPALAAAQMPILLLLGTRDTLVPIAVGEAIKDLAPTIQIVVIDKAGHVPFLSHPQIVLETITQFMDAPCH